MAGAHVGPGSWAECSAPLVGRPKEFISWLNMPYSYRGFPADVKEMFTPAPGVLTACGGCSMSAASYVINKLRAWYLES